jgi:putative N6-adenine-specific DNA methylase
MTLQLVAAIPIGFEKVVAKEIRSLGGGIGKTRSHAGRISFEGPDDAFYRCNLGLRTAERILVQVGEFSARTMSSWTNYAARIPWELWIEDGSEVELQASTRACRLFHTGALHEGLIEALRLRGVKASMPASKRGKAKVRPMSVDIRGTADRFVLCVDTSGAGLHRRGYRKETAKAPLRETLAAALLQRVGWTPAQALCDPMCGSGTFLIEAGLLAQRRLPGLERNFSFVRFPCFDETRWAELRTKAKQAVVRNGAGARIEGADREGGAVRAARSNLSRAGMPPGIKVSQRSLADLGSDSGRGLVVLNPPYGKRLQAEDAEHELLPLWAAWSEAVRASRPSWDVLLLAPGRDEAQAFGVKGKPIARFRNGGLPISAWHVRGL